ncbi:MAG: VWA domain-containing protein [Actinobacteria bacterium]|nr:VWA domain-containing protein [Actinomycetota bacterium]
MQIDLKLQHQLLALETEHDVHAMIELTAPTLPADRDRTPLSLALVLDRSGSMSGEKLETVKRCAAYLVDQLQPTDELAIVTFDDTVDLVVPLQQVQPGQMKAAIAGIHDGGMTNLSGGWLKGREELERTSADGRARRVLLLTDGQANQGITDRGQLTGLASRTAAAGIGTTTIGYGADFDEQLLTDMADAGGGVGWFAETVDDAPRIFAEEFSGLVQLAAQNVSVEIRPTGPIEVIRVLNDYPSVGLSDGVQVQLGDAYAGQRLRFVFELHVPELAALGPAKLAEVVVRYVTVGDTVEQHEVTYPLMVNLVSADEAATAIADPDVTEEVTVLLAAKATEDARRLADEGDFDAARALLDDTTTTLRAMAASSDRGEQLRKKADDLEATAEFLAPGVHDAMNAKRMHYRASEMKRNRW